MLPPSVSRRHCGFGAACGGLRLDVSVVACTIASLGDSCPARDGSTRSSLDEPPARPDTLPEYHAPLAGAGRRSGDAGRGQGVDQKRTMARMPGLPVVEAHELVGGVGVASRGS